MFRFLGYESNVKLFVAILMFKYNIPMPKMGKSLFFEQATNLERKSKLDSKCGTSEGLGFASWSQWGLSVAWSFYVHPPCLRRFPLPLKTCSTDQAECECDCWNVIFTYIHVCSPTCTVPTKSTNKSGSFSAKIYVKLKENVQK